MLREGLAKDAMRGGEQGAGGLETSKPKGRRAVKLFEIETDFKSLENHDCLSLHLKLTRQGLVMMLSQFI